MTPLRLSASQWLFVYPSEYGRKDGRCGSARRDSRAARYIAQDPRAADRRRVPAQRNAVSPLSVAASRMPLQVVDGVGLCIGPERAHPVASALEIPGGRWPSGTADGCARRTGLIRAQEARRQILVATDVFGPLWVFAHGPGTSGCCRSQVGNSQIFGLNSCRHPVVQCRQTVI